MTPGRRRILLWLGLLAAAARRPSAAAPMPSQGFAPVVPGYRMRFPHDEGSHPGFRVEWWYITGWLEGDSRGPVGFQITFFRARPAAGHENPSAFAAHHIIIGHAALSDPSAKRLLHNQRAARASFGLAGAGEGSVNVWLDGWSLRQTESAYRARIPGDEFLLDFEFRATQPPLLNGEDGYSRKGPAPRSASYYYSIPHLTVSGALEMKGGKRRVNGIAWMDHEWSSEYLEEAAAGWDWIGINLDDGGALMAFRMRGREGGVRWAGATLRTADGRTMTYGPGDVIFTVRREWRSARSGATYPVSFTIRVGDRSFGIEPLFDDQEQDARASTGTIYWEGAVRATTGGRQAGRGYLELTGYWRRVTL